MLKRGTSAQPVATPGWTFSPLPALEEAIQRIWQKHPPLYPDGIGRQLHFLRQLGNPQQHIPFAFHIAGTNGKGSTLAFLQAIFESAGLHVHKYTSPHLVSFDERIIVNSKRIAPDLLLDLIDECERAATGEEVSFFEFFTALAFLAFRRNPANVALLETGLGGLYDATNVLDGSHHVSLLTRISYDHTHILGHALKNIAAHKAGIIKPGAPCIVAPQDAEARAVFERKVHTAGAPAFFYGKDWQVAVYADGFEYKSMRRTFRLPLPRLQGEHQIYNAGLALAALENSPFAPLLEQRILESAMQRVEWPGRLQNITTGPLAALLPPGWELWLDGAHNDSGAQALAGQARRWDGGKPLHLITAMKRTKDASGFYRPLLPYVSTVQALDTHWVEAPMMPVEALAAQIRQLGCTETKIAATLESAIHALTFQFDRPQRILVAGSLYLIGDALKRQP